MRTVVAAPICERKLYSLDKWAAATASYDRVMTTEEEDLIPVVEQAGIPCLLYQPPENEHRNGVHVMHGIRFNTAWQSIVDYARDNGYDHILSLESDVIPEGDILAVMEREKGDEDFLIHLHPWRAEYHRTGVTCGEMGCTMASTETFARALERCFAVGRTLYGQVRDLPFTRREINVMELSHLDG